MANSLAAWRNYLNQRRLTTGMAATPEELQALRMAELEAAYNAKAQQRAYAIQEKSLAQQAAQNAAANALTQQSITNQANQATASNALSQQSITNQYNLGLAQVQQAEDAAAAQRTASLIGSAVQLPTATMSGYELGKRLGFWGTSPSITPGSVVPTSSTAIDWSTLPSATGNVSTTGLSAAIPSAETSTVTMPMSGMASYGTNLPAELANVYETGANASLGAGETAGSIATTATDLLPAAGDAAEIGSLVPEAYGGIYEGIGGVGSAATETAGTGLGSTIGALTSYAAPVGAGLVGGSLGSQAGQWVGEQVGFGGSNEWGTAGGIAGGAATGLIVGGPIGALVGGLVGGISSLSSDSLGTVICTELHRQGFLDDATYDLDGKFGKMLSEETMDGYHAWAEPLVRAMRGSSALSSIVRMMAMPTIKEMVHRVDSKNKGSIIGSLTLSVGLPICQWIGSMKKICAKLNNERV